MYIINDFSYIMQYCTCLSAALAYYIRYRIYLIN